MTTSLPGVLALALTLAGPLAARAAPPRWTLLAESTVTHKASVAAFVDEKNGMTAGYAGTMYFTHDGGKSWSPAMNASACRFGLEARPGAAFTVGNAGNVRASADGGEHWTVLAQFGRSEPGHARFLSFVDAKRGLVASPEDLGLTADGGNTWTRVAAPPRAGMVAAVSLSEEGGALLLRVLDENGALWLSGDAGKTWAQAASPLTSPVFESMTTPWAAMRFTGAEGVLAAFVDEKSGPRGRVFRTRDGGKTWAEEQVQELKTGTPTFSYDGKLLVTFDTTTVHVYRVN
jgi:photosystem II stability/assembly factor-like uncharacterized protein